MKYVNLYNDMSNEVLMTRNRVTDSNAVGKETDFNLLTEIGSSIYIHQQQGLIMHEIYCPLLCQFP